MRIPRDDAGVSEIVGALLLVLVVSSAAFGFGLFLHQQQKETQAQQAADLAVRLEKVEATSVVPVDLTDPCDGSAPVGSPDGTWDTLSFTLAGRHLHDSTVTQLLLGRLPVKTMQLAPFDGSNVVDFGLAPADPGYKALVVPAGGSVVVRLQHASCSAGSGQSPFFDAPSGGLPVGLPLQLEFVTALGNHVERVFTPPVAQASLEPVAGVAGSYVLVGTASQPGTPDTTLVKWAWEYWHAATCGAAGTGVARPFGHRAQVSGLTPGDAYCARLVVTDDNGLSGQAELQFTA